MNLHIVGSVATGIYLLSKILPCYQTPTQTLQSSSDHITVMPRMRTDIAWS